MYPLSPRNCFGTSQNSRVASGEVIVGLSCAAYPNSSNESLISLRDEGDSAMSEFDQRRAHVGVGGSDSKVCQRVSSHRAVLRLIDSNYARDARFFSRDENQPPPPCGGSSERSNVCSDLSSEHNVSSGESLGESYVNLTREQLYRIIYRKDDELQQARLQLNEARMRELSLGKSYELSVAKQNELKTINSSLENLVTKLRSKKTHQINSVADQLKLATCEDTAFKGLQDLCRSVAELKEAAASLLATDPPPPSQGRAAIDALKAAVDRLTPHEEAVANEVEHLRAERQQLIRLLLDLSSNSYFYFDNNFCDNELRSENVKQVNVSLCDQIQILEFKLRRSNEVHKKRLCRIKSLVEEFERSEGVSSCSILLQEIKNEASFFAS